MNAIVLATHNPNKVTEFQRILSDYQIISMSELHITDDIPETGATFAENAILKADFLRQRLRQRGRNYIAVADDSGLCVNALNGAPGVHTARYLGVDTPYAEKRAALLQTLLHATDRTASYQCVIAAYTPDARYPIVCRGVVTGSIAEAERGENGFAFDSIFYSSELQKTFGEATAEEKDIVSHRARAIRKLLDELAKAGYGGRDDETTVAVS